jgi:methyl-accepting chemotaxis protein
MFKMRGIVWKLILPIPVALAVGLLALWVVLPELVRGNARDNAVATAQQTVGQFKTLRAYYTENVIKKATAGGALKPSTDHKDSPGAIPLPATMIHDLSELLRERDTTISLYSGFPFPNRSGRGLDSFQQEAWAFLTANPDQVFVGQEQRDGKEVVRVAVADKMVNETCVACHNSHAQSPKKDWKLNDVRGVLEVASVITPQLEAGTALSRNIMLLIGGMSVLVIVVLAIVGFRMVAQPLGAMSAVMARLACGEDTHIPALDRRDEIGAMAHAVQVFKNDANEKRRLEAAAKAEEDRQRCLEEQRRRTEQAAADEVFRLVSAAAEGDFSQRLAVESREGFWRSLCESINLWADAINGSFSRIAVGVEGIKGSTAELSAGVTDLSSRTEEQVASLEQVAASVRQLNTTVQQSADNASQASQLAIAARNAAENGGEVAKAAVAAMGEIEQSSQRISDIVGMIDEIAFQTNLLALNAAVEAARAGEAGRGFAVVAGEVRALAQRSSQASKDIKSLILNSSGQVKQGVELVNRAGGTLAEIVTSVKRVSDIVAEIATSNREQSASVNEVQEAVGQIEQTTQQNAALVEESTAAIGNTDNQVQEMFEAVARFKLRGVASTPSAGEVHAGRSTAKGAKVLQAKLSPRVGAAPAVGPTRSVGAKKLAATGTDDGWEEF